MKFGDFNKLACGDHVILISAIDILMQVGQNHIWEAQPSEVVSEIKKSGGNLFSGDMLEEIAKTVQELVQLRTCRLLAYVKRSGLDFRGPNAPRSGLCPICSCAVGRTGHFGQGALLLLYFVPRGCMAKLTF